MAKLSEEREAELRESGWSDAEVRDYRRGYEQAVEAIKAPPRPAPAAATDGPGWFPVQDHFPRSSELGQWQAGTWAGKLTRLLSPEDDAAELAEARRLREQREYAYETPPPPLRAFRAAVRHDGERGVTVAGSTAEVVGVLRAAGISVVVSEEFAPPTLAGSGQPKIVRI